jgi:hypothetical protein
MLKRRREQKKSMTRDLLRELIVPWCRKFLKPSTKTFNQELKQKNTTIFKKNKNKEKDNCFTYDKIEHYARECPNAKWKPNKKSANMIERDGETLGYGNLYYLLFLVYHSSDWWVDTRTNIHECADIFFLFSTY